MRYSSGTGVNISCSSFSISSSDLAFASSSAVRGGSHDAISRWLLARARLALLKIMSASLVVAGMVAISKGAASAQSCVVDCGLRFAAANHDS